MTVDDAAPAAPRQAAEALWQKVEDYRPYLRAVAERVLGPGRRLRAREDASDVVQKALLRGYAERGQLQATTQEQFLAWLVAIVRNVALNTVRAGMDAQKRDARREQPLPEDGDAGPQLPAGGSSPGGQAARKEEVVRLLAAVARLPPDEQEVVHLHALAGLSYEQVARELGTTRDVVRGAWRRGFARLRALLRSPP
jgi:RNA polymerase sigma-70 factor (ECF subfamily)